MVRLPDLSFAIGSEPRPGCWPGVAQFQWQGHWALRVPARQWIWAISARGGVARRPRARRERGRRAARTSGLSFPASAGSARFVAPS